MGYYKSYSLSSYYSRPNRYYYFPNGQLREKISFEDNYIIDSIYNKGGDFFFNDTTLNIVFDQGSKSGLIEIIQITPNSTKRTNYYSIDLGDSLNVIKYRTIPWEVIHERVEKGISADKVIKEKHNLKFGKITVFRTSKGCDDSGRNPFIIKIKMGTIRFNDINNLVIVEVDLNKDNKNELYLVSYVSCMSFMKICRIE